MRRLTSVICGLILGLGLVTAFSQPAKDGRNELQGSWTAVKAIRDGKAAQGVVGNRLTFAGKRFRIQSKQGKLLYRGTFRADPSAKPGA